VINATDAHVSRGRGGGARGRRPSGTPTARANARAGVDDSSRLSVALESTVRAVGARRGRRSGRTRGPSALRQRSGERLRRPRRRVRPAARPLRTGAPDVGVHV